MFHCSREHRKWLKWNMVISIYSSTMLVNDRNTLNCLTVQGQFTPWRSSLSSLLRFSGQFSFLNHNQRTNCFRCCPFLHSVVYGHSFGNEGCAVKNRHYWSNWIFSDCFSALFPYAAERFLMVGRLLRRFISSMGCRLGPYKYVLSKLLNPG